MPCSSSCSAPGTHATFGECLRAKRIQIDRHALSTGGLQVERDKDRRLYRYEDARRQGLQPRSTRWGDIRDSFETGGVAPTVANDSTPLPTPNQREE